LPAKMDVEADEQVEWALAHRVNAGEAWRPGRAGLDEDRIDGQCVLPCAPLSCNQATV
jgi:hypothetical protein